MYISAWPNFLFRAEIFTFVAFRLIDSVGQWTLGQKRAQQVASAAVQVGATALSVTITRCKFVITSNAYDRYSNARRRFV